MRKIFSVCLLAAACMLAASSATGRGEPAVGISSDELKVAPPNQTARPQPRDSCKQGYVWREARPSDHVCVTPQTRTNTASQNRAARRLWVPGAYGPHTCVPGYVWREAFKGDDVCVRPDVRERTRADNQRAAQRRIGG